MGGSTCFEGGLKAAQRASSTWRSTLSTPASHPLRSKPQGYAPGCTRVNSRSKTTAATEPRAPTTTRTVAPNCVRVGSYA